MVSYCVDVQEESSVWCLTVEKLILQDFGVEHLVQDENIVCLLSLTVAV